MTSQHRIRRATPDDIAHLHRIRIAVRENRLSDPGRITAEAYRLALGELGCGWVSLDNNEIVGFAIAYRSGEIWALFVDPQHEGRGHGRRLHTEMMAWLAVQGPACAELCTSVGTRAHAFYVRLGWQECGLKAGSDEIKLQWRFAGNPALISLSQ